MAILMKNGYMISVVLFSIMLVFAPYSQAHAERIKDVASFEGVRDNQLMGYGLVVGLSGTGDKGDSTVKSIVNMLMRLGLTVSTKDIKAKNTAAVIVTATLSPFPKAGTRVDALVSAIGDASNLQGGTLLMTPLKGPDGEVYAVAQGPVSIGGFIGGDGGTRVQKNHPTVGNVPQGAIVELEPPFTIGDAPEISLFLHRADFVTASSAARAINRALGEEVASARDSSSVSIRVPEAYKGRVVDMISAVELVDINVDTPARVIINERTGTVIIGENVKLSPVAIAHGNLTIDVKTSYKVSQPNPFAPPSAKTVVTPEKSVGAKEQTAKLVEVYGVTLGEIVKALNALGVTPRDMVAILQALKSSGALKADLEIM